MIDLIKEDRMKHMRPESIMLLKFSHTDDVTMQLYILDSVRALNSVALLNMLNQIDDIDEILKIKQIRDAIIR